MKLYGTKTSPYVRRVRIILNELGLDYSLIDTSTEDGQNSLRKVNPIWKIPTLDTGSEVIFDSHTIIEWLFQHHKRGGLRQTSKKNIWTEKNFINAADAILDSGINLFYLAKDKITLHDSAYLTKQHERIATLLNWFLRQLSHELLKLEGNSYSYATLALVTTIDWLRFRKVYPLDDFSDLVSMATKLNEIESIGTTMPH